MERRASQPPLFMRMVGLEPTRGCPRKILSLVRLPFRHIRLYVLLTILSSATLNILSSFSKDVKYFFKVRAPFSNTKKTQGIPIPNRISYRSGRQKAALNIISAKISAEMRLTYDQKLEKKHCCCIDSSHADRQHSRSRNGLWPELRWNLRLP